ncbi:DNA-binding protein [Hydrogenophaga sp.]|uniref:DNA-binding protein n=1 Tax=Hydrogenophaga sp. TaxID=1904254 RepID=UPI00262A57FF|nr:DNA-binding protein [Hydrogenophaga sp.]MDM7950661.1 DNA-binding protein [Hydrogenophaga sp.]
MARGITEDEVWKACDVLLLEGSRPTIERVRQKLGRGSPNTVSPMLETWFKHLGARITDPGAFSAPASMPDLVHQAGLHLWEAAQAEARRDLAEQLEAGLAAAASNVEAEKERAKIAEAAAFAESSKAAHLQAEVDQLRKELDAERAAHVAAAARLHEAHLRQADLQADLEKAREAIDVERVRGAQSIAAADERAAGAERRAAKEIEHERMLRSKTERSAESVVKRLEVALRAQVSAEDQLGTVQLHLTQLRTQAKQREQELEAGAQQRDVQIQELEAALSTANVALSRASAQDALVRQLVVQLGGSGNKSARRGAGAKTQAAKKGKIAA